MKNLYLRQFLFLIGLIAALTFQNCADPLTIEGDQASSEADKFPFAYALKMNALSYMSCSERPPDESMGNVLFSFKVGSYGMIDSGVGLNENFLSAAGSRNFSVQTGLLTKGKQNSGAHVQMALRYNSNLKQIFARNGDSSGDADFDYDNILGALGSENLVNLIVANAGKKTNFFGHLPGTTNRHLEGTLHFSHDEELAAAVRTDMNGNGLLLTTTFGDIDADVPTLPLSPDDSASSVYGSGWSLPFIQGFGQASNGSKTNYGNIGVARVIDPNNIREIDLQTGYEIDEEWICDSYLIVRPEDNGSAVFCGGNSQPQLNGGFVEPQVNSEDKERFFRYVFARYVLPVEYWHIDLDRNCIVPKTTKDSCYADPGDDGLLDKPINYTGTNVFPNCGGSSQFSCPHYASVCYRAEDIN